MNAEKKFQKAKIGLLLDEPFFGSLLCNLNCQRDDSKKTMATDSVNLKWNAKYVDSLPIEQIKTVLAHEVLHCALLHPLRRSNRDNGKWNQAADYATNHILNESNQTAKQANKPEPFPFPDGALLDNTFSGMSAEDIYNALPEPPPANGQGQGNQSSPGMGEVEDAPQAQDEAQAHEQETRWKVAVQQAATMAKGRGELPATIARLVDDMLNPKADWREILRRFIRDNAKDDYSWTKPNPRYAHSGFILPSLHSQQLGKLVVAIDTSGSIDAQLLNTFCGELEGIISEARPSGITVIECDSAIGRVIDLEQGEPIPRDYTGGGGTDFRPVFEHIDTLPEPPVALIYLTDLDGSYPDNAPAYPVLWGVYQTEQQAPFGETIHIDQ